MNIIWNNRRWQIMLRFEAATRTWWFHQNDNSPAVRLSPYMVAHAIRANDGYDWAGHNRNWEVVVLPYLDGVPSCK